MTAFAVELKGVSKRYGSVQALDDVSMQVTSGGIHALVGENGAGKTTLMRALYGAMRPDAGALFLEGQEVRFPRSSDAIAAGVGMVSQHYSIISELTCLQNLMLGAEASMLFDHRSNVARADELAARMGFAFEWDASAEGLSPGAAQKLEILKLLWRRSRFMILDEPTAMLSPADGDALFASLGQLAREGATILLVTHRLPEVLDHCVDVTVLRGGKKVADRRVADTNASELAELIVGHALEAAATSDAPRSGARVLEMRDVVVRGSRGEDALKGVAVDLAEGVLVGIAGVDGSGQRELMHTLAGVLPLREGTVRLDGEDLAAMDARTRLRAGVRLIPEDRHTEGVIEEWSLEENVALGLQRLEPLAKGAWIDRSARHALATQVADRFKTRHGGLHQPMASLSGGNQQRFVAARALALRPRLVLAFQPARGLDIDGTRQVYDALREQCRAGSAAVVVSFDLDELLEHCDRVVVMNGGELTVPADGEGKDRAAIGRLMVGAS